MNFYVHLEAASYLVIFRFWDEAVYMGQSMVTIVIILTLFKAGFEKSLEQEIYTVFCWRA